MDRGDGTEGKEEKEKEKEEKRKKIVMDGTDGIEGSIRGPSGPKKYSLFLSEAPLKNPLACLFIALTQGLSLTVLCCVSLLLKLKL